MTPRLCPHCRSSNTHSAHFCANCGKSMSNPGEDGTVTIDLPGTRLVPGSVFAGRYLIIEELGEGGMGRVYRAIDQLVNDEVALKMIRPEIASERNTLDRFSHELKIARRVVHKNVGRMHDLAEDQGNHYITMEYIPGQDLKGLIRQTGRLTVSKALFLAEQIGQGLAEAHRLGIVHRDLKPGNIMIDREGNARIMDFGLALSFAGGKGESAIGLVGTPAYMSPEQLDGREVDPRTDIYALGVLLFEMLTGRRPFAGETPGMLALKHRKEPPPDPREFHPQIPPPVAQLILRCLEKERDKRYPDAETLLADLDRIEVGMSSGERSEGNRSTRTGRAKRPKKGLFWIGAVLGLLAIAAAIVFLGGRAEKIASIAVLPFETAAEGQDAEYLSEGITEGIISRLTLLPKMEKVIALSSVLRYKGKAMDPQAAGRELGVDAVLANRLTRRGEEVTLIVELMRVRDNSRIWGRQYPYRATDVFAVQEQIVNSITDELRMNLTGEERRRMTRTYTTSYEAFQAYSQGRYFWDMRTAESIQKAIVHFERAVQIDPNYALAYAGLSYSYCVLPDYMNIAPNLAYPKARESALRALEIDAKLAHARVALAQIHRRYDLDWAAAEAEYKLAIEYDPNDALAHHWYGYDLMNVGRFDEAVREIRRARELDPFSLVINRNYGQILLRAKRYGEAEKVFKETLETAPTYSYLHYYLGVVYLNTGRPREALEEFQVEDKIQKGSASRVTVWIGVAYSRLGRPEKTREILDQILEQRKKDYVSTTLVAILNFTLGQNDEGFRLLEEAVAEHDSDIRLAPIDPVFDPVRSDPRFAEILRKTGYTLIQPGR